MPTIAEQLSLHGLDETLRRQEPFAGTPVQRARARDRVLVAHDIMTALPDPGDLAFLHSGLCQTFLPHSRPARNHAVWVRQSGRFSLLVTPGVLDEAMLQGRQRTGRGGGGGGEFDDSLYVGVPYGSRARLILIYLQSEGQKSRTVSLGGSLSAFLRSLGLPVTGGPRGTITAVKEQCKRIARCSFTLQWRDLVGGVETAQVRDSRIVDGLELWRGAEGGDWTGTVELSTAFHEHLKAHSVPLDKRAIAHLSGNSLGLDLYSFFAYRLHQLREPLLLRWASLQEQIGSDYASVWKLGQKVREVLPDVLVAYPHANVEAVSTGLLLRRSDPPVPPRGVVNGYRLVGGGRG